MPCDPHVRRLWAGLWRELLVLSGWSVAKLHSELALRVDWRDLVGSRASFHRLLHELPFPVPRYDGIHPPRDDGLDHTLRIHQVVTEGTQGTWRVALLAWDVQTTYLNAVVFEVLPPSLLGAGPAARRGRPPINYRRDQPAHLVQVGAEVRVRLPVDLILDFAEDTRAKMGVPVGVLHLASSLGDTESLAASLLAKEPHGAFVSLPARPAQLEIQAGRELPIDQYRRCIAAAVNRHNGHVAHQLLRLKRRQLQSYRDAAALLPADTSDSSWLQASAALQRKVRLGRLLVDYDRISPIAPHRGAHLSCRPVRLLGQWAATPLSPIFPPEFQDAASGRSVLS